MSAQNHAALRRRLVAGNWKMNGTRTQAAELMRDISAVNFSDCDVVLVPPFVYLLEAQEHLYGTHIGLGAQSCSSEDVGAYTGDVSAQMLKDVACHWVLVGHSERRSLFGEDDSVVLKKTRQIIKHNMNAIVCVGETLDEREAGRVEDVIKAQLQGLIDDLTPEDWQQVVIAYEPVWAIGTGRTATPEQAQQVHAFVRAQLAKVDETVASSTRIIYGGSVNAANAAELFAQPDVDGGLVGGASLKAKEFIEICQTVG